MLLCYILQSQAEQVGEWRVFRILFSRNILHTSKYYLFFLPLSINIIHLRLNVQKHAAANPGKDSCVASSQRKEDLRLTKVCPTIHIFVSNCLPISDDVDYLHLVPGLFPPPDAGQCD